MHPELTELTNRIAAFAEHGDPQPVLDPEAVLLARRIWTGASGDEPPVEVVHVVAQLHWCRVLALPAGQREEDIELSARLFGLLLPTHPELVPDKMRRMLARSADQWAEQAAALLGAIDNTDDPAALTRVIDLLRWSVTCSPIDHPDLPGRLSNLGVALRIRFDRDGRPAALDQAVKAGLAAVAVGAADHRDRGGHLYNAGGHLHLRFRHGAAIADLDQAVSLLEQAVHATRPDQAAHFEMVDELGRALAARCEASRPAAELGSAIRLWLDRGGGVLDWQRAVVLLRHLLSFEPATADRLTDLGHALTVGSTWTGSDTDLDEAIDLLRRAAADTPAAETDHGGRLARLASALRLRFERTGAAEHLEEAAALLRRALTALPTHHPDRDVAQAEIGVVLYQRFSRTGALPDLDEAITHLRDVAQFNVLGIALRARFERTGKPADQAESVDVLRRAVAALPAEHPERAFAEANLATTLLERWQRSGTQADIDQVIGLLQQAAAALPKPSPQHRQVMSNLGVALRLRYERTGVAADLDRAISAAMANSSPNSGQLSNLAVALIARFRRDSTSRDLDTAITILTDVVASTPGDDPRLSGRQSSLGLAISERFKRDGRPEDLQRAIGLLELALAATPGDHPHRAPALSNLATVLADRSDHDGLRRDRDRAVGLWQEATGVLSAPSHTRLTAAEAWAEMLAGEGQWDRALKGYNVAVELLDTTVWNAADRIGRERQIAYWAYLGGDSAACAVAAGRPGRAMELLEQGRGVLWSQTLNRRTDTTALVSTVKALADRLVAIRSELDQPTDRPV